MTKIKKPKSPSKMTPAQRRVAIAKDVLKHLKAMKVCQGTYCFAPTLPKRFPGTGDAQKHVGSMTRNCQVCALGAMMLSHVRLFDKIDLGGWVYNTGRGGRGLDIDRGDIVRTLHENGFSHDELNSIEDAFERYYGDAAERLGDIMRSIVKNRGSFDWEEFDRMLYEGGCEACRS